MLLMWVLKVWWVGCWVGGVVGIVEWVGAGWVGLGLGWDWGWGWVD